MEVSIYHGSYQLATTGNGYCPRNRTEDNAHSVQGLLDSYGYLPLPTAAYDMSECDVSNTALPGEVPLLWSVPGCQPHASDLPQRVFFSTAPAGSFQTDDRLIKRMDSPQADTVYFVNNSHSNSWVVEQPDRPAVTYNPLTPKSLSNDDERSDRESVNSPRLCTFTDTMLPECYDVIMTPPPDNAPSTTPQHLPPVGKAKHIYRGPKKELMDRFLLRKTKKFCCPYCQITCSNQGQLNGHIRSHKGNLLASKILHLQFVFKVIKAVFLSYLQQHDRTYYYAVFLNCKKKQKRK